MPSVQKTTLRTKRRGPLLEIRSHRSNVESRLIYSNNRKAFFSYVYSKINSSNSQICITINNKPLSDKEAANVFPYDFRKFFFRQ